MITGWVKGKPLAFCVRFLSYQEVDLSVVPAISKGKQEFPLGPPKIC